MQFNVAQLLQERIGSTRTYELVEDISELDSELDALGPLVGTLHFVRIHSGILVTGELSTAVRMDCNRCLAPIATPVRFAVEESYRPLTEVSTGRYLRPEEFEGEEDDLEDAALIINAHHILDISEIVRQNIWLAAPMIPGCNWEGPGECPNFQEHLASLDGIVYGPVNAPAANEEETINPRWSALLSLREELDDTD
ncbi:MAG: DUF177 domain-containing protein [Caldilineaceae bacterium]|nr:DUF177 domain-containing protein [Caldilineaceae bacterium]